MNNQKKESSRISQIALGTAGFGAGYASVYPWIGRETFENYPRLREIRKVGQQEGFKVISPSIYSASLGGELRGRKDQRVREFLGKHLFSTLDPVRSPLDITNFGGVVYAREGEFAENLRPRGPMVLNWGNWDIGVDKGKTWEYFKQKNISQHHAETILGTEFYQGELGKRQLSSQGKSFIEQAGGIENLILKKTNSSLGQGVWMNASTVKDEVAAEFLKNPQDFLLQKKLNLQSEFRVITVGGKAIYSAHRFGSPALKTFAEKVRSKFSNVPIIGDMLWNENIQPIANPLIRKDLASFAENIAKDLPYDIGAFDIGLTKEGTFKIIEAQRQFGSISNPIVSRRIKNIITGRKGKLPFIVGILGAGMVLGASEVQFGGNNKKEDLKTQQIAFLNSLSMGIEQYGTTVGTGHKRIAIPKDILSKQEIEKEMGFVPVSVAIPEAGQITGTSWRHPESLIHIHSHKDFWTLHEDKHAAATMLVKQITSQGNYSPFEVAEEFIKGVPHAIKEGIPGAFYWAKGGLFGEDDEMVERVFKEMPDVRGYEGFLKRSFALEGARARALDNKIPGGDDYYNTIEGLRHGGMAEKGRKKLSDFGSGYDKARQLAKWLGMDYEKFLSSGVMKEALENATHVKQLGAGKYGRADLFEAVIRKGQEEQKLSFVKKSISQDAIELTKQETMWFDDANKEFYMKAIDFQREANVMKMGQDTASIATPYHVTGKAGEEMSLFMEYMPGEQVSRLRRQGDVPEDLADKIRSSVYEMTSKNIAHQDLHGANVLFDKETGRVSLLDFGLSEHMPSHPKSEILAETIGHTEKYLERGYEHMHIPLMPDQQFKSLTSMKAVAPISQSRTAAAKPRAKQRMQQASKQLEMDQQKIWEAGINGGKGHLKKQKSSIR